VCMSVGVCVCVHVCLVYRLGFSFVIRLILGKISVLQSIGILHVHFLFSRVILWSCSERIIFRPMFLRLNCTTVGLCFTFDSYNLSLLIGKILD